MLFFTTLCTGLMLRNEVGNDNITTVVMGTQCHRISRPLSDDRDDRCSLRRTDLNTPQPCHHIMSHRSRV